MTMPTNPRARLSRAKHELQAHYDAIVVGSGYGGGVAALRLAQAGLSVCVIERGTERLPHEFPTGAGDAPHNVQTTIDTASRSARWGDRLALFDLRVHDTVSVIVGCGVGGTSLINANVFVVPDESHFTSGWPVAFSEDRDGRRQARQRADEVLAPTPEGPTLAKMALVGEIADHFEQPARRLPLMVQQQAGAEGSPDAGLSACTGCGNCCSGCRVGAKRSVDVTYLRRAVEHGAAVFSELDVHHVAKAPRGWSVHYRPVCRPIGPDAPRPWVTADLVVLAAGTLGSTEILLRSRDAGLPVSRALGTGFSANGNTIGAVESPDTRVRGIGNRGGGALEAREPGPCITMSVQVPASGDRPELHIEDGTVPAALGSLARMVGLAERVSGAPKVGVLRRTSHAIHELVATAAEAAIDADENALALLVQCDDGARGRLELGPRGIAVRWPDYGRHTQAIDTALEGAAAAVGGRYRSLRPRLGGRTTHLTVHPLGGCPMGTDRYDGVVDHTCAVFDPDADSRAAVHDGLYVCDGSVIPRAVGKNPAGTICVVAERAMALAVQRWRACALSTKRTVSRPSAVGATVRRSFALTEAFDGWLSADHAGDPTTLPASGHARPRAAPATAHFGIEMADFAAFASDPSHVAGVLGTVTCALLGGTCAVVSGRAYLLADDPVDPALSYNLYDLQLLRPDGARWLLSGTKVWRDGGLDRLWAGGTQMVVEVFAFDGVRGDKVATGLLRMSPAQFAGSVRSYQGRIGRHVGAGVRAQAEFLAFSAARLRERWRLRR